MVNRGNTVLLFIYTDEVLLSLSSPAVGNAYWWCAPHQAVLQSPRASSWQSHTSLGQFLSPSSPLPTLPPAVSASPPLSCMSFSVG